MSDIIRYGPWANGLANAINPITDFSDPPPANTGPVNCTNTDWITESWGVLFTKTSEGLPETFQGAGVAGLGQSIELESAGSGDSIRFAFYYQASESFNLTWEWEFKNAFPPQISQGSITWEYETLDGSVGSGSNNGEDGSEVISLPSTFLGRFTARQALPSGDALTEIKSSFS